MYNECTYFYNCITSTFQSSVANAIKLDTNVCMYTSKIGTVFIYVVSVVGCSSNLNITACMHTYIHVRYDGPDIYVFMLVLRTCVCP